MNHTAIGGAAPTTTDATAKARALRDSVTFWTAISLPAPICAAQKSWNFLTTVTRERTLTGPASRAFEKVKRGEIHGILVKDFSRFGRSYIEVGDYLEQIFPFLRVRFISVNDGFDSARQECSAGDVSVAFKSLCNDYYSKDLFRKVRDGGKYHASTAPFGYLKASEDIHRIVVDPHAAAVIRRVYEMALGGMGAKTIAKTLNAENIMTPGRYKLERTGRKVGYNTNNVWTGDSKGCTIYRAAGTGYDAVQRCGRQPAPSCSQGAMACFPDPA